MSFTLQIGDVITVIESPDSWNSFLSSNSPLDLKYPLNFEVLEIKDFDQFYSPALKMRCIYDNKEYGFSYTGIIDNYKKLRGGIYLSKCVIKSIKYDI